MVSRLQTYDEPLMNKYLVLVLSAHLVMTVPKNGIILHEHLELPHLAVMLSASCSSLLSLFCQRTCIAAESLKICCSYLFVSEIDSFKPLLQRGSACSHGDATSKEVDTNIPTNTDVWGEGRGAQKGQCVPCDRW